MKTKQRVPADTPSRCFTITVDGKKYGPFLYQFFTNVAHLEHAAGIAIQEEWIYSGWVPFAPPPQTTCQNR